MKRSLDMCDLTNCRRPRPQRVSITASIHPQLRDAPGSPGSLFEGQRRVWCPPRKSYLRMEPSACCFSFFTASSTVFLQSFANVSLFFACWTKCRLLTLVPGTILCLHLAGTGAGYRLYYSFFYCSIFLICKFHRPSHDCRL